MIKAIPQTQEEVNCLIGIPNGFKIDIGDGRILHILKWSPEVGIDRLLSVKIEAVIHKEAP